MRGHNCEKEFFIFFSDIFEVDNGKWCLVFVDGTMAIEFCLHFCDLGRGDLTACFQRTRSEESGIFSFQNQFERCGRHLEYKEK